MEFDLRSVSVSCKRNIAVVNCNPENSGRTHTSVFVVLETSPSTQGQIHEKIAPTP